jgi:hypothetical protein
LPSANATIIQGFFEVELPFKNKTGAEHNLFPAGLLNMFMKTPSEMMHWPSTAGE